MATGQPKATASGAGYPPRPYAFYVIGVLMLVTISSQFDRHVTSLLVEPIQQDLGLSDTRMSLVHGAAFALFYTIMGVPFGRLVDHQQRRNLIIVGLVAWSVMTLLCGLADNFWELFFARMGVGIGEACLAPAAYSLIADYVEPRIRGRALAAYYSALVLGQGASLMLGALVLSSLPDAAFLDVPGLGRLVAWQLVFVAAALPCLVLAPLMLTVKEPIRRGVDGLQAQVEKAERSLGKFIAHLKRSGAAFTCVYTCFALGSLVGLSFLAWAPTFLVREFGIGLPVAGLSIGVAMVLGGLVGTNLSGALSDICLARGYHGGRLLVPTFSWLLLLGTMLVWPFLDSVFLNVAAFGVFTFSSAMVSSSAPIVVQDLTPNHMRGQAVALYLLMTGIGGTAVGPTAVALVTDRVLHDPQAVGLSMLIVCVPCALIGLLVSVIGLKPYEKARRIVSHAA